jgi:hypothetical protein
MHDRGFEFRAENPGRAILWQARMQSKKPEPAGVQYHRLYRPTVAIFNLQQGKGVVVHRVLGEGGN